MGITNEWWLLRAQHENIAQLLFYWPLCSKIDLCGNEGHADMQYVCSWLVPSFFLYMSSADFKVFWMYFLKVLFHPLPTVNVRWCSWLSNDHSIVRVNRCKLHNISITCKFRYTMIVMSGTNWGVHEAFFFSSIPELLDSKFTNRYLPPHKASLFIQRKLGNVRTFTRKVAMTVVMQHLYRCWGSFDMH